MRFGTDALGHARLRAESSSWCRSANPFRGRPQLWRACAVPVDTASTDLRNPTAECRPSGGGPGRPALQLLEFFACSFKILRGQRAVMLDVVVDEFAQFVHGDLVFECRCDISRESPRLDPGTDCFGEFLRQAD